MKTAVSDYWLTKETKARLQRKDVDPILLASLRRSISDFVRIVSGKNIPVRYKLVKDGDSYTDSKTITISSDFSDLDLTVGLALHEGTHISETDFSYFDNQGAKLKQFVQTNLDPQVLNYMARTGIKDRNFAINVIAKRFHSIGNWVEDRRIDNIQLDNAPGYYGYYEAFYNEYFHHDKITTVLQGKDARIENWFCYEFRVINLMNVGRDLTALKGLEEIWRVLDLKNIARLKDTTDTLYLAVKIMKIIDKYIEEQKYEDKKQEEQKQKGQKGQGEPQKGNGQGEPQDSDTDEDEDQEENDSPSNGEPTPSKSKKNKKGKDTDGDTDDTDGDTEEDDDTEETEEKSGKGKSSTEDEEEEDKTENDSDSDTEKDEDTGSTGNEKDEDTGSTGNEKDEDTGSTGNEKDEDTGSGNEKDEDEDDEEQDTDTDDEEQVPEPSKTSEQIEEEQALNEIQDALQELTPEEINELLDILDRQKDAIDGEVKKTGITEKTQSIVDSLTEAGTTSVKTGVGMKAETTSSYDNRVGEDGNNENYLIETIVIQNLTKSLIDSKAFECFTTYPAYVDVVAKGIELGKKLAKKLQVMNEERETVYNRKSKGKLDRNRVHALGYESNTVFYTKEVDFCKPVLVYISIDGSGSMSGQKWANAQIAAIAIAQAAEMIPNLNVVITYRFSTDNSDKTRPLMLIAYDSRKDNIVKIKTLFPYLCTCGYTPEGLCFEAIQKEIGQIEKNSDGYFINFSDGQPEFGSTDDKTGNRFSYNGSAARRHTRREMDKIMGKGIQVLSFFIEASSSGNDNFFQNEFKLMYGKNSSKISVTEILPLTNELNKMFISKATK